MKHDQRLRGWVLTIAVIGSVLLHGIVLAATVSGTSSSITINSAPYGVESVKIALPGGELVSSDELTLFAEGFFPDGDYQYELIGVLPERAKEPQTGNDLMNGRGDVAPKTAIGVIESGDFRIVGGRVFDTRTLVENQ